MVFAYRNLWPLLTFVYAPADRHEGAVVWVKLVLSGLTGVFVPLCEPFPYIPFDLVVRTMCLIVWSSLTKLRFASTLKSPSTLSRSA
jgi:hypothetical protein